MSTATVTADLPPYEPPPPWLPPDEREKHHNYNNDLRYFLPRRIYLRRNEHAEKLGFDITKSSIYVAGVMQNSEAQNLGLQEGDQILNVNGINFENIHFEEAVQILKSSLQVHMTVRFFPYGYMKAKEKDMAMFGPSSYR